MTSRWRAPSGPLLGGGFDRQRGVFVPEPRVAYRQPYDGPPVRYLHLDLDYPALKRLARGCADDGEPGWAVVDKTHRAADRAWLQDAGALVFDSATSGHHAIFWLDRPQPVERVRRFVLGLHEVLFGHLAVTNVGRLLGDACLVHGFFRRIERAPLL